MSTYVHRKGAFAQLMRLTLGPAQSKEQVNVINLTCQLRNCSSLRQFRGGEQPLWNRYNGRSSPVAVPGATGTVRLNDSP
ncbi:hypothetical protein BHE74_00000464 [Ensete ventricosum]|nr:hypothetical protein GW17_00021375 [Ensete ventricosum]RWW90422.1 hypothetical protein BHE74_00000464 [Ensete ventricosum]